MTHTAGFNWNDEAVAILRRMWTVEGRPASAIAALLGITRNAVLGKAHRMQLLYTPKTPKPKSKTTVKRHKRMVFKPKATETVDLPPENPVDPVRLMDLRHHHCRWPVAGEGADMLFCGATRLEPHAWCGKHCGLAYARPATRADRWVQP